ncbi:preprotein translocase subunit SecF [bacterium BMS3Abin15]|nr:preprotein translocase subunit SecF [bacterium BMS3Abin15]HDZ85916.1 protein translocase subunit SecF [Candidatus Moranbacteria bacterium]
MYQIINKRKYTYIISAVLIVLSVTALSVWGLRLGIDFKGGTLMEVQFSEDKVPASQDIQDKLSEFELDSLIIQPSENNVVILRYIASDDDLNSKVLGKIKEFDENVTQLRVDFIGASVSDQLKGSAVKALIFAIFGIALYIAWAFRKVSYPVPSWQYGLGAVIALAHDIIITLGAFAFLGKFYGVEVGIPFVAALLTILGYSVNDTIVVYDRTRENILRYGRKENFEETVNKSVNETLARSINTSLTVIVVLLAIIFFGGETIKYFSIALLIGVGFGTYSSIYVASALLVTSYKIRIK